MDEELAQILSNSELDETAKAEAIKIMVGKSFVPTSKYNTEKANTKAQTDALNALQTEFDKFKQSKMTDDEKKIEQEKIKEEKYQKQNLVISKMIAENTFAKAGIKEEDYKGILDNIVQEDSERTKALAETICNSILKQKQDIEKELTDKILKGTKIPPAGNDNTGSDSETDKYNKLLEEATKKNDFINMAYYSRLLQQAKNNKK